MKSLSELSRFYLDFGIEPDLAYKYAEYAENLLAKKLPVIFEMEHLSNHLDRDISYLHSVIYATDRHYRQFKIPKRSGGTRTISAPYPSLLECQRWIDKSIIKRQSIHQDCHSYQSGKSIISNAKAHLGAKVVLKMDLTDFFGSIGIARVCHFFSRLGYAPNVAFQLASICCLKGSLPQGAATSPGLSNIIGYGLDVRLAGLAKCMGLKYTRYADDLCFSGDYIGSKLSNIVTMIATECGFDINSTKTCLMLGKTRKMVTGINVVGDHLRLPRSFTQDLRKDVYYIEKYGLYSHLAKRKISDPAYLDRLIGKAAFWLSVEPNSERARSISKSLSDLRIDHPGY